MSYADFITKNNLWRQYFIYRSKHLKISNNRAMRSFCLKYGYIVNRRQCEINLQKMIKIAKTSWLDKELPL